MRIGSNPLVSIIIPTYKRPTMLPRAVNSVLNQTYSNVEVIVVDDNNPDTEGRKQTERIMADFEGNSRVKYIKHPCNKNGSAARNTGARASDAKYIGFLDDDDEYLPHKIESQVDILESRGEEWGVCYSRYRLHHEDGRIIDGTECREGDLYVEVLTRNISLVAGSNILVKKKAFEEIHGFDESFQRSQDIEFLARLLKKYKLAYSPTLGVIVYIEAKYNLDFNGIISQYIKNFSMQISELTEKQQKDFYDNMSGQLLFHAIRSGHGLFTHARVLNGRYSFIKAVRYVFWKISTYLKENKLNKIGWGYET